MKLPISQRLLACAGLVSPGDRVADIGCDHGYLSIYLLTQGIARSAIASDIHEQPLLSAVTNAEKYGVRDKMEFYLSDGVRKLPRDFDCMVCAGMGADTMISILEAALRRFLSEQGWRITEESVLRDGRFLYTVMEVYWEPEYPRLTAGEWYFPPALLENPSHALPAYYRWVLEGLKIATAHREDPTAQEALRELTALAEIKELTWLKEESK